MLCYRSLDPQFAECTRTCWALAALLSLSLFSIAAQPALCQQVGQPKQVEQAKQVDQADQVEQAEQAEQAKATATLPVQRQSETAESASDKAAQRDQLSLSEIARQASRSEVDQAIKKGVEFLIATQNKNGSWGSATKTKDLNIYAPVPGAHHAFGTATTALCISALCELEPDYPQVKDAIDRAQTWLFEHLPKLRRATADAIYNVWGHGYGIQALVRLHARSQSDEHKQKIAELIQMQFTRLGDYESVDGGWGYYDFDIGLKQPAASSTSFVNATILIAFHEAKRIGIEPPKRLVDRAIAATLRQQKSDLTYFYGEYLKDRPMLEINRPGGSLGRSQACNLAMRLWGDQKITDAAVVEWLERLIRRHGWLDIGRKRPIPHESWMLIAGYFFYYGHYYAAYGQEQLPMEQRQRLAPHLAGLLIDRQETDGSWWDYPLYNYHPPYGTSFALMSLLRYRAATQ